MEPQIIYDLPESEYHSVDATSASLIKKFLISPVDAFDSLYGERKEDTAAMIYGSAMHKLILEGRQAFESAYTKGFDKTEFPDALDTVKEIVSFMDGQGIKATAKNKTELIEECLSHFPDVQFLDRLKAAHGRESAGKTPLSASDYNEISGVEWVNKLLPPNGKSEVSIFWDHPDWGPCKCRLDHLANNGNDFKITDLKSFTNSRQKPVERAVEMDIFAFSYHLQAAFYTEAVKTHFDYAENVTFDLLFIEKGKQFPNILPRDITMDGTELGTACGRKIDEVAKKIAAFRKEFGALRPWNRVHNSEPINIEHLPSWSL